MSRTESQNRQPVPDEVLAEASVWVAKLHGDSRGRALEQGFRRWLIAHPNNARAFEIATAVWEESECLRQIVPFRPVARVERRSMWRPIFATLACAMVLAIVGVVWFHYAGVISTKVGEQRQLALQDGTRVILNTDTAIKVKYDESARRVELRRGEALFNVAKHSDWPFIVVAGDRQVKAVGTSFVVRKEAQRLAVTLVEGSVVVSPVKTAIAELVQPKVEEAPSPVEQPAATAAARDDGEITLAAGQRLTFSAGAATRLDTPSVEKTTAWRRGQVILDDTPLRAAAAEMNRYSESKLIVEDSEAASLLINGLFQAGDSSRFANAVAQAHGLTVIQRGNEIVLSGKPVQ